MVTTKTIRLVVPDWQAGNQPVYQLGAEILAAIAPNSQHQPEIRVEVPAKTQELVRENGINGQSIVRDTVARTRAAVQAAAPDKIVTFGGNCLVSQAPFDYLNRRYQGNVGVVWLDAHPDISKPEMFYNEHAMVLGNLLGAGDPVLAELVSAPLRPEQVYFAGLQHPTADEQRELQRLKLTYQLQTSPEIAVEPILTWLKAQHFDHLMVHFDIDALNPRPTNFYDTYFNNPNLGPLPDNAAQGRLHRQSVWRLLAQLSRQTDLVGLTIAEYLPWGAQQLRELMNATQIFG
ncbi:arginase family protein [Levilactobacillus namurensis]|uniref:arginase family protein n=1 Tax=Levilactobacillus namurensis TaxID=380393 RepID=UPI000463DCEE|nr:arginase family protein [Levilactobacillus namurensis]